MQSNTPTRLNPSHRLEKNAPGSMEDRNVAMILVSRLESRLVVGAKAAVHQARQASPSIR